MVYIRENGQWSIDEGLAANASILAESLTKGATWQDTDNMRNAVWVGEGAYGYPGEEADIYTVEIDNEDDDFEMMRWRVYLRKTDGAVIHIETDTEHYSPESMQVRIYYDPGIRVSRPTH